MKRLQSNDVIYQDSEMTQIKIVSPKYGEKVCTMDTGDYESKIKNYHIGLATQPGSNVYYGKLCIGNGESMLLHKFIIGADSTVDHIDGNGLNCRRNNLRTCTHAENMRNTKPHRDNKYSGFKGVSYDRHGLRQKRYIARIGVERRSIYLGIYETAEEAARAYNTAAVKYFGEFAHLNDL